MKKIAIVCLVLGALVACKSVDRVGVTDDAGIIDAGVSPEASASMLTDPAEPLPPYLAVPPVSVSASAVPAPAASK